MINEPSDFFQLFCVSGVLFCVEDWYNSVLC